MENNQKLIRSILKYFAGFSTLFEYQELTKNDLNDLFSLVIMPNLSLTSQEIENFEDNPEEFIKIDIEESD